MWRLIDWLLGLVLITAGASALFVLGTIAVVSSWRNTNVPSAPAATSFDDPTPDAAAPLQSRAVVELRLTSRGGASRLFAGQPLVFDVVLLNLEARRARNRARADPAETATTTEIPLDDATTPWERRLMLCMTAADGTVVLGGFDWHTRLLDPIPSPSGRRLGPTPARATFVLDEGDLASLRPGPYVIAASLPPGITAENALRIVPLELAIGPAPHSDADSATISLAVAQVAALRGDTASAIEAAKTAIALDPSQDRGLTIIAEAYEDEGDLDRAIEWYDLYLETLDVDASDDYRKKLKAYIEALRRQP